MKYKVGDRIKLLKDTTRTSSPFVSLMSYILTLGEIYTVSKTGDQYIEYYTLREHHTIRYSPSFIEDENYFKLLNRKLKLERILK